MLAAHGDCSVGIINRIVTVFKGLKGSLSGGAWAAPPEGRSQTSGLSQHRLEAPLSPSNLFLNIAAFFYEAETVDEELYDPAQPDEYKDLVTLAY